MLLALQVRLYFPGGATNSPTDPYAGVLRAVVKDSTDLHAGESSVTFLDSNGDVGLPPANLGLTPLNLVASDKPLSALLTSRGMQPELWGSASTAL